MICERKIVRKIFGAAGTADGGLKLIKKYIIY
jgi:hypothetical protein